MIELSLRCLNITSEHWCFKVLYWWFNEIFSYLRPHHYDKKPLLFQVLPSKGKPRIKVSIGFYYCKFYIKNTKLFKSQWVSQINKIKSYLQVYYFPKIFVHNNHDSYSLIQVQLHFWCCKKPTQKGKKKQPTFYCGLYDQIPNRFKIWKSLEDTCKDWLATAQIIQLEKQQMYDDEDKSILYFLMCVIQYMWFVITHFCVPLTEIEFGIC